MVEFAINTYTSLLEIALPFGIIFAMGNIVVGTFMRVAFGGKLWFGK